MENLNYNTSKEQPFRVPEGYFEELPDKIIAKCQAQETKSRKNSPLYILKPAFSLAAMFIGFAIIAHIAVSLIDRPANNSYTPNDIARAEYEENFSSEQEFIEAMKNEEMLNSEEEANEYIDYLLNDDIDYGVIIDELNSKKQDTSKE
ncbi:MAG: hypothetical protein R6U04_07935 [Bacteroidales bacterium]